MARSVICALQVVELVAQRGPAVDDQEHVAERVVGAVAGRPAAAVGRHRVDAVRAEAPLPRVDEPRDLGDVRRDRARVAAVATPPTCGRSAQRGQRAAAEVEAVELHLGGVWVSASAGDERAQQRRLAALRAADDGDVPGRAGQVAATAGRGAARTACRRCRPAARSGPRSRQRVA